MQPTEEGGQGRRSQFGSGSLVVSALPGRWHPLQHTGLPFP